MPDDTVDQNLQGMDNLDFIGWNTADWHGEFARYHTDDVYVFSPGMPETNTLDEHITLLKAEVDKTGGVPQQIVAHPIKFGQGEWTCVVGQLDDGTRLVTVAKWRDGKISEEYIWM